MSAVAEPRWAAVALGSNLGDRAATMSAAVRAMDRLAAFEVRAISSLYESAPWGDTDQGPFLNAVVVGLLTGEASAFLSALQAIEATLGKRPVRVWGPRTIDLDLLAVGEERSAGPPLDLPHPRAADRPFVYLPLREASASLPVPNAWSDLTNATEAGRAIEGDTHALAPTLFWSGRACPRSLAVTCATPEETLALGRAIGAALEPGDVVALDGPLGAGKTCLVHGVAEGLGIHGPIPSPSFTLCREYHDGRLPFRHWDFYRLEDGGDLESTGFPESLDGESVTAIEWADRFASELPTRGLLRVRVTRRPDDTRAFALTFAPGMLTARVALGGGVVAC